MANPKQLLAVDVGGTEIKAALLGVGSDQPDGPTGLTVRSRARRVTPRGDHGTATAYAVVNAVAELTAEFADQHAVAAVGVVVPGVVHNGVGIYSANLGWQNFPFRDALTEATGRPVAFGHDTGACGLAEFRLGAARGYQNAVVMPIGTGIAGAIILDGDLRTGGGYAGEIGHVDVGHGLPCGCGLTGCMEAMASSAAIARRYTEKTGRAVPGAAEVLLAVTEGDAVAVEVWDDAVDALARGIRILATLLGPEVVVLGGGLAMAGDLLAEPVAKRLAGLLSFQRRPALRLAELGDEAGCLGAGLLALDLIEGES
ncbi:MAG TPA: ROK family protein [Pseudonocardiaceae bacterium]|nr:ROK family protein [Pseudonocardiaceae bacterium]